MAFFSDPTYQHFRFSDDVGRSIKVLEVEGTNRAPNTAGNHTNTIVTSATSAPGPSGVYRVPPPPPSLSLAIPRPIFSQNASKKAGTLSLKILQAKVIKSATSGGKPEFKKTGQIFTQLAEHTATVPHILSVANETWGPGHVLVTNDGLQILDCSGTRGMVCILSTSPQL